MTEITLPWPPKELSPNARIHWARLSKIKKKYRADCWALTKGQNVAALPAAGNLRLELDFYRPQRRAMDRDNLLARMKSGLDGVADALGINDARFEPILTSVRDQVGGYVTIRIFTTEETI